MSPARNKVTLANLSEFARLMPHGIPRDQVLEALGGLSLECSLGYDLSKTFLADGWIVEYRHLRTAGQLNPVSDLLLFATSGGLKIEMADGSTHHVKCGEHVMLPADSQATVFPVGERDSVSFIALAIELDLGQILQELTEVPPA